MIKLTRHMRQNLADVARRDGAPMSCRSPYDPLVKRGLAVYLGLRPMTISRPAYAITPLGRRALMSNAPPEESITLKEDE